LSARPAWSDIRRTPQDPAGTVEKDIVMTPDHDIDVHAVAAALLERLRAGGAL
jgi:hypothetical protein